MLKSRKKSDEYHLFIVWEKARNKEDRILNDIRANFSIVRIFEVTWSKKLFSENLTRFYGTLLPANSFKEEHCGNGPFLLIIVKDKNPKHARRVTSTKRQLVNTNIFDAKKRHRDWTDGGHKIHATNSREEFRHDLSLLLGLSLEDFLKKYKGFSEKKIAISRDLHAASGWKSLQELFYLLNQTSNYVVLRNFKQLPDAAYISGHEDIDLLVDDLDQLTILTGARAVFPEKYRVHYKIKIGKKDFHFDFRHVGDGYYDTKWQKDILRNRVLLNSGIYVPSKKDYTYSLAYHALVHKRELSPDYFKMLSALYRRKLLLTKKLHWQSKIIKELGVFMKKNTFKVATPKDTSVLYNTAIAKQIKNYLR